MTKTSKKETLTLTQSVISHLLWTDRDYFYPLKDKVGTTIAGTLESGQYDETFTFVLENGEEMKITSADFEEFKKTKFPNWTNMGLKKEYKEGMALVFDMEGGDSISDAAELSRIAKEDFPALREEDIKLFFFNGGIRSDVMGVRFRVPTGEELPGDYDMTVETH